MLKYLCLFASIIASSLGHIAVKSGFNQAEALKIKNTFVNPDGTLLEIGGKTGTGEGYGRPSPG